MLLFDFFGAIFHARSGSVAIDQMIQGIDVVSATTCPAGVRLPRSQYSKKTKEIKMACSMVACSTSDRQGSNLIKSDVWNAVIMTSEINVVYKSGLL